MENWEEAIIERLEAAYRVRFEREQALIFLNDAYQNALFLKMKATEEEYKQMKGFLKEFVKLRDAFIGQLIDRYPGDYSELEKEIRHLHQLYVN